MSSSTSSSAAYSTLMSSICKDYESYEYSSYSSERAALDSAIDEHAGTDASYFASSAFAEQASSYCNSDARSFEVAASFKGFGVEVDASTSTGSSLARCGSQSAASSYTGRNGGQNSYFYGYNPKLQEAKFGEAKANVKQLRSTVCGIDSYVSSNSDSVRYLQQVMEPAVVGAYTGCLDLFKAGLQVKQSTGIGSHSFSVDLRFTSGLPGATAFLEGVAVSPYGTAVCRMLGCRRNSTRTSSSSSSSSTITRSAAVVVVTPAADGNVVPTAGTLAALAAVEEMEEDEGSSSGSGFDGSTATAGGGGRRRQQQRSLLATASPPARQQRSPPRPPPPAGAAVASPPPAATPAECPAAEVSMNLEMEPNAVYSLLCELAPGAPADGGVTDVYLSTSVGGTYKGILVRNGNQTRLAGQAAADAAAAAAAAAQEHAVLRAQLQMQTVLLSNLMSGVAAVQSVTSLTLSTLQEAAATQAALLRNLTAAQQLQQQQPGPPAAATPQQQQGGPRVQVSCGGYHTCVAVAGALKCWGRNGYGQLGQGLSLSATGGQQQIISANVPPVALPNGNVVAAASGGDHTCVLLAGSGAISCWGSNAYGQLGFGDKTDRPSPPFSVTEGQLTLSVVDLGPEARAVQLAVGGFHVCALLSDSRIKCWGHNDYGGLGLGDVSRRGDQAGEMGANLPAVDLGLSSLPGVGVASIAAGCYHSCALLTNGRVKCWGNNVYGQLQGLGNGNNRGDQAGEMGTGLPFVNLGTGVVATSVTAGCQHTCALLANGTVKCWGFNFYGQLGLGHNTTKQGNTPADMDAALPAVDLGPGELATAVVAGGFHTCALLANSSAVKCWGRNDYGQLGYGDKKNRGERAGQMGAALPVVSLGPAGTRVQDLSAGLLHTCALLAGSNAVKCWGANDSGQLGLGDTDHRGDSVNEMGVNLQVVNYG